MQIKKLREKEGAFSKEALLLPGKQYSPVYSWAWNAPVTKEKTDRQLDEFVRLGIKSFYIIPEPKLFRPSLMPTLLEPDYLTKPYFEEYKYALESAFSRGLTAWIYNEGGWPSGGACGEVLRNAPELARRSLDMRSTLLKAGEAYKPSADVFASYIDGDKIINSGFVAKTDVTVFEYYSRRHFYDAAGFPDIPDLTKTASTDAFIASTHEKYKPYLSDHFEKNIPAVFTDEPTAPRPTPFYPELVDEYEKRHGESILPYLPSILNNTNITEDSSEARIRWFDLCSELFCKNYLLREKDWCNKNGMEYLGHMDVDHTPDGFMRGGNFNLMRALRCMDTPGIDVIWRQIFPCKKTDIGNGNIAGENSFFPRYASSAAAQIGSDTSLSESFAVYGNGITYEQMRYVIGAQAIRGINVFNPMLISYGREGFYNAGELPSFREDYACFSDLKKFNEYTERLCYLLSLGERSVNTALYLPIRDIWAGLSVDKVCADFEKAGFELEKSGASFDIIDDDILQNSDNLKNTHGRITSGKACYDTVIIPPCKFMSQKAKENLGKFVKEGGRLYTVGKISELEYATPVTSCKELIQPSARLDCDDETVLSYERICENCRILALFNSDIEKAVSVRVYAKDERVYIADLASGILKIPKSNGGEISLSLDRGETAVLIFADKDFNAEKQDYEEELLIDTPFSFRKTKRFVLGTKRAYMEELDCETEPIKLGDWRYAVGEDFSGSGIYSTVFSAPKGIVRGAIKLGNARYSAEVFLNGKSLGTKVMSPFVFEFDKEDISDKNLLEIRITNSVANAYKYTSAFDVWAPWQLSTYFEKEQSFNDDSLAGGLFGPVKLMYDL